MNNYIELIENLLVKYGNHTWSLVQWKESEVYICIGGYKFEEWFSFTREQCPNESLLIKFISEYFAPG